MKSLLAISIALIIAFALFSRYIKQGGMRDIDFAVTVKMQERIDKSQRLRTARFIGEVMEGSTFFASPQFSVIAVLLITAWGYKRLGWRAVVIPILFGILVFAEVYGKTVVHHPSPPFFMIKNPTTIFPKYYINDEFSYPSGHAARAVFLAVTVWLLTKQKKLGILFALALYVGLVGVSRVYLGHHWFSDIIGGGILGFGLGFIAVGLL